MDVVETGQKAGANFLSFIWSDNRQADHYNSASRGRYSS